MINGQDLRSDLFSIVSADEEQLALLRRALERGDIGIWNQWREENPTVWPNLCRADLIGADLRSVNLHGADLRQAKLDGADLSNSKLMAANLQGAELRKADLSNADLFQANLWGAGLDGAILRRACLIRANLFQANLCGARLHEASLGQANLGRADLTRANLYRADLSGANLRSTGLRRARLRRANLEGAQLIRTDLQGADLIGAKIYGVSAWSVECDDKTKQSGLIITYPDEAVITVDDLEVAQFVYLVVSNQKIRNVINTVANKAVLILGCFTTKRKAVLDSIANKVRALDLVPIVFDFEKSDKRDIIETVVTLAGMCKFVIADVTSARVIPDELRSFVPDFAIPVVPVFQPSAKEPKPYASLYTLHRKYHWFFKPVVYHSAEHLIDILSKEVIEPAEAKRLELRDAM